jgi:hypothetical protein
MVSIALAGFGIDVSAMGCRTGVPLAGSTTRSLLGRPVSNWEDLVFRGFWEAAVDWLIDKRWRGKVC